MRTHFSLKRHEMDSASYRHNAFARTLYPIAQLRFTAKLLLASMAVMASAFFGVASAANLDAQVRGHLTRPQGVCPDGATLCGTASIAGYGNAEYRWFLGGTGKPSGSCGHLSRLFDYDAIVMFTLPDGSKLKLHEMGTLCAPGNSFPTGGPNSYGNPQSFNAHWQVVLATGKFAGLTGSGTSSGAFAGAAIGAQYHGTLTTGGVSNATVLLSWEIVDSNGAPLTCADVGASHVRVVLSGTAASEVDLDCDQMSGQFDVTAGDYTTQIEFVDSAGNVLASTPVVGPYEFLIGYSYDLGHYVFQF